MRQKLILHAHLCIRVNDDALLVSRDDKLLEVGQSDGLNTFAFMYRAYRIGQLLSIPCENVTI